ncbi:HD domain-containing protein [Janthinobacterium sp. 61]|nr:HD domain-containing protein [Janthinobacterium sp. 61]
MVKRGAASDDGDDVKIRRIYAGELALGVALPWDVHSETGGLLARLGHVISSENQIELLLARGVIADTSADLPRTATEAPSALRMLNLATAGLALVLPALAAGQAGSHASLASLAQLVEEAVVLDADVALACILHNQGAGDFAVRHSVDTAVITALLARALKLDAGVIRSVVLAALSMNVGMLERHADFQHKAGPLDAQERAYLRAHPQAGVDLLRSDGVTDAVWLQAVLQHHENIDGSGYPLGTQGEAIGIGARLIMLADRYCARVSKRSYRQPMLPNVALREMLMADKATLDAPLASLLVRELGIYPVGTFVKLLNGEIGIVTRKGLNATTPHVQSLIGPRGARLDVPLRRDTRVDLHAIREVLSAEQAGLQFRPDQLWGRSARA